MAESDLIAMIVSAPYIWIVMVAGIIGFVILKIYNNPKRPETRPFWGEETRKKKTNEQVSQRAKTLGVKVNFDIYRGMYRLGKAVKMDEIPKQNPHPIIVYNIAFRNFGFMSWLMSLFGRYKYLMINRKAIIIDQVKKRATIDPNSYLLNDSGIWTLSSETELKIIDELNIKKDVENVKGFTSDFLRRLSNESPNQAIYTERQTHEADLEERKRKSRISSWVGK